MALVQILMLTLVLLQGQSTAAQSYLPPRTLGGNDAQTCPLDENREQARNELSSNVRNILGSLLTYQCGGSDGWTRIAYLDMTDPAQSCPSPWTEFTSGDKRVCFRSSSSGGSCDSVIYDNLQQQEYSQVCGRIIGYQYGNPQAFYPYDLIGYSLDSFYVDGISVTYGQTLRRHIWTFAAGFSEVDSTASCPCGSPTREADIPPYIGNNYFCETGTIPSAEFSTFYPDDPLWDGMGCGPGHSCECELNSPPWFTTSLVTPTTDAIEVRSCSYEGTARKNVGIEVIELYVK